MSDSPRLNAPVDRRLAGKNKSVGNRERFLRRHKDQVREAVRRAVDGKSIRDVGKGDEEVHIPKRDLSEPVFGHGQGGIRDVVHPGNKDFIRGDRIDRPKGGGGKGSGSGQASDSGEGEDDFVFSLSKEEFWEAFFGDLALPNMIRTILAETPEWKSQRAGYSSEGTPNMIAIVKSKGKQFGRRNAMTKEQRKELEDLQLILATLIAARPEPPERNVRLEARITAAEKKIARLERNIKRIRALDPMDIRYRARIRVPVPTTKAVMFCLMDISGSMDEARKDLSKRFFILLYLFLTRHYERIELVFIRHHTQAQVVNEEDFFHSRDTGGTVVSSALTLMDEVISGKHPDYPGGFPSTEWNIYGAQCSDGDNWHHDSGRCAQIMREKLLPLCRYYAYIQVAAEEEQNLWDEYEKLHEEYAHFVMRKVRDRTEIYPVFRDLFKKEGAKA